MPDERKPNILFFFTDQQRWDTLGCYGNPMEFTPHLDRLAAEGVRFEQAFTCQPVCGPARACLQTGTYATANGVWCNGVPLRKDQPFVAEQLRAAGYATGYIGKFHLSTTQTAPVPAGDRIGYDFWEAADILEFTSHPYGGRMFDADNKPVEFSDQYRVDFQTDRAIDFMGRPHGKPFFLFLSFLEPHFQNDMRRFVGPDGSKERFRDPWVPLDLRDKPGDWPWELPDYYGCCAALDTAMGRIVARLKERGLYDNTLIVFTSDHGCHFRTRNSEYKRSCHESSIRIPMIVHGPGFTGGSVVHDLAGLIDLPPTLLDSAGVPAPAVFHGSSLAPLGRGDRSHAREEVFVQISEAEVGRAIRTDRWKYAVYAPDKDGGVHPSSPVYVDRYLYDLKADPHESVNLIGRGGFHRNVADDLMERLKRRMAEAGEAVPEIRKAEYYA
ncbi:MAG: sulfatase-like hydrolase/transferase [Planctomycetota bacterium]